MAVAAAIDLVQLRTRVQDYFSSVARPTDDDLIWPANSKERERINFRPY